MISTYKNSRENYMKNMSQIIFWISVLMMLFCYSYTTEATSVYGSAAAEAIAEQLATAYGERIQAANRGDKVEVEDWDSVIKALQDKLAREQQKNPPKPQPTVTPRPPETRNGHVTVSAQQRKAIRAYRLNMILNIFGLGKKPNSVFQEKSPQEESENWLTNVPNASIYSDPTHKTLAYVHSGVLVFTWFIIGLLVVTCIIGSGTICGAIASWVGTPIAGTITAVAIWVISGSWVIATLGLII